MNKISVLAILLSSTLLGGCVPLIAVGAGAAAGVTAGQEGGVRAAVNDTAIKSQINDRWYRADKEMFNKIEVTVDQGRVLLTGVVQNPEQRVEAVRLAWEVKGVKQVINEIQIGQQRTLTSAANDTRISGQLKTQMLFYKDIQSVNYTIDTVNGVVYLMGVAQNTKELNQVIRLAQRIKGVKQVASYVKMVGEPIVSSAATKATTTGVSAPATSYSSSSSVSSSSYPAPTTYGGSTSSVGAPMAPKSDIQSEVLPP